MTARYGNCELVSGSGIDLVTCMVQEQFVAEATGVDTQKKMTGIRVVRANKAQNVEPVAVKAIEIEPGKEECFNKYLVEAEGDVGLSASLIAGGLRQGELEAAVAVPALVEYMGVMGFMKSDLGPVIIECLECNTGEAMGPRLVALKALGDMANDCGKQVEPYLMHALPSTLKSFENKDAKVRSAAEKTSLIMMEKMNAHATRGIVDILFQFMDRSMKWQVRTGALKCLGYRAKQFPTEMGHCMLDIMPILSESVVDTRAEVAEESSRALLACCYTAGNRDLEPHVPAVVSCIKRPGEVSDLVAKLSATTFVQTMEDACLAVLVPIMDRALKERSAKTQRRAAIIIENMSKLVLDPADARPFLPVLIPALETVAAQAADPELRDVAGRACSALKKIKEQGDATTKVAGEAASKEQVLERLESIVASKNFDSSPESVLNVSLSYVAKLCTSLIRSHIRGTRSWDSCCVDYLMPVSDNEEENKDVSKQLRKWALTHMGEIVEEDEEFDDELCNCEFSLAYGGRILLTNTILRLRRGRRYGLCGANGAGKSTLMKAIANEQLDGFPPKEELRTVYVAHDMDASVSETPVADFMFEDPVVQEAKSPSKEQVVSVLTEVGFSPELQASPIASLSGGWKMKLALARAMLIGADILLLDEPTNHLDTTNVAWLINYLTTRTDISSMIVSHDSGFLDAVCTDIIHYENRKLVHYVGNLSEFVKVKPEAKSYYELSAVAFKFKFPEPGFLDGVKGKRQPVIRVSNMSFTYPGAKKPQLQDVTARCAMGSRVAVIGRNGAGKSTLIKLLTGETLPTAGTVWKHPNLRIAYVAQHAFHHIEEHLDKTPAQYLWWRFGDGEDREAKEKATRKFTEEELKARQEAIESGKRVVDFLNSRRMGKSKEYEYEVQWVGQSSKENVWYTRTKLVEELGLAKMVEEMDAKVANFRNYRALTNPIVISHLKDFGIEEEIAAHNMIRGLSGGQKVKLVLAAAMWCQPHLLVLDEPTNYLDRDSLGALAAGIEEFNGGVIMISHNNEFTSALCKEEWHVGDGKVVVKGQSLPEVPSMASLTTVSSVASLSTLGGGDSDSVQGEELDPEMLEEKLKAKESRRLQKERLAAEKKAKKAEKTRLKYLKKF